MIGSKQPDKRIQVLLEKLDLKFEVTSSGDYVVGFSFEDGRTQDVHISSETQWLDRLEIRDIYSFGFTCEAPPCAEIGNFLLLENSGLKMGAWELIHGDDDNWIGLFRIPIAADSSSNALLSTLETAAKNADYIEEKFTSEDKF